MGYRFFYKFLRWINRFYRVYSADGWDVEVSRKLPFLSLAEIGLRYYEWDRIGEKDTNGLRYHVEVNLFEGLNLGVVYDDERRGSGNLGYFLEWDYDFDFDKGFQGKTVSELEEVDLWSRRYDRVRRENKQQIFKTRNVILTPLSVLDIPLLGVNTVVSGVALHTLEVSGDSGAYVYTPITNTDLSVLFEINTLGVLNLIDSRAEAGNVTLTVGISSDMGSSLLAEEVEITVYFYSPPVEVMATAFFARWGRVGLEHDNKIWVIGGATETALNYLNDVWSNIGWKELDFRKRRLANALGGCL